MRHTVRQARVCVVNKLIREARNLRTRGKSEKQQESNKKRADRFIGEVYALKLIKDDEITKFGITNEKDLREILQTPAIDESMRIMARIVNYKSLRIRLDQFREQFPDYKKYVVPIRKKFTKKKPNIPKSLMKKLDDSKQSSSTGTKLPEKKDSNIDTIRSEEDATKSIDNTTSNSKTDETEHVTKILPNAEGNLSPCNLEPGTMLRIKPTCTQGQEEQAKSKRSNKRKMLSKDTDIKHEKKSETVRVINKEATVKRFTEVLQEENMDVEESAVEKRDVKSTKAMPELEKEIDEFFMSTSDGNAYYSAMVPKAEASKDESLEQPHSRNMHDRFFSKINKPDKPRWGAGGNKQTLSGASKTKPPIGKQKLENKFNKNFKRDSARVANTENENLHPSWAAKKKQQEAMKQGFQGKKIVFNDD